MAALPAGLRQLGYEESRNLVFDAHWAEGKYERLPVLVAELVQWKPDVLVASGDQFSLEIKKATTTIPIVSAGTIGAELSRDSGPGCKARLTAKPRVSVAGPEFSLGPNFHFPSLRRRALMAGRSRRMRIRAGIPRGVSGPVATCTHRRRKLFTAPRAGTLPASFATLAQQPGASGKKMKRHMNTRRKLLNALGAGALSTPLAVLAQAAGTSAGKNQARRRAGAGRPQHRPGP